MVCSLIENCVHFKYSDGNTEVWALHQLKSDPISSKICSLARWVCSVVL
jgi:hypothetical protein